MRKLVCVLLLGILFSTQLSAQTISELKKTYNIHQYKRQYGDPYNPALSGIASYFIPGLGQIICNETDRGLAFLGGYVGCLFLTNYASDRLYRFTELNENYQHTRSYQYTRLTMISGIIGYAGIWLWNIVDAVQVAKVKNLYQRDTNKTAQFDLELNPFVTQLSLHNNTVTPVGLTVKATF